MSTDRVRVEGLLRDLAPRALVAVLRRHRDFADAEDAVQEALVAAAAQWPDRGVPDNPTGWLVRVATRRLTEQLRRDDARRRREQLAASISLRRPEPTEEDDSLRLLFLCCHPSLPASSAIPLTLRAVGGLTTREIAAAFLVPEATMAQRISRAKAKVKASGEPFAMPDGGELPARLRSVLRVLYLVFNEGYAATAGDDLARVDLSAEAIRLTRMVHAARPDDPEVAGLCALMLLTDARRAARTDSSGELVPLDAQDRTRWDRALIAEGTALLDRALAHQRVGEYQLQAAIAAAHDRAPSDAETDWAEILSLYGLLERMTGNPMVTLNRAVAAGKANGPAAGLAVLDGLEGKLGDHHRFHAVRAHLLEQAGDVPAAAVAFDAAAAKATNARERNYLTMKAARLRSTPDAGKLEG